MSTQFYLTRYLSGRKVAFGGTFPAWELAKSSHQSKLVEVIHDFAVGPVDGAHELAKDFAVAVNDVGFRELEGAIEGVGGLFRIAHGEQVDVVVADELPVGVVVGVQADCENRGPVPHLLLQLDQ